MSEAKGRCRSEMDSLNGGTVLKASHILADALDRLAADVAEVKEAVCDGSVAAERDRFLAGMAAAIRERDEARSKFERLDGEVRDRDARIAELIAGQTTAIRERNEAIRARDACEAELKAELAMARAEFRRLLAEAERLRAELAARPAANSSKISNGSTAAGWLTEDDRHAIGLAIKFADLNMQGTHAHALRALLARAGSPPVVEVPMLVFGSGSYEMQKRYRAAMDKAGVQWKEVPSE